MPVSETNRALDYTDAVGELNPGSELEVAISAAMDEEIIYSLRKITDSAYAIFAIDHEPVIPPPKHFFQRTVGALAARFTQGQPIACRVVSRESHYKSLGTLVGLTVTKTEPYRRSAW